MYYIYIDEKGFAIRDCIIHYTDNFITKQPSNYPKYIYSNLYSKEDRVETVCDKVNDYGDNNIRAFVAISHVKGGYALSSIEEYIDFETNNGLWVFINKHLFLDYGGYNTPVGSHINITNYADKLGLIPGITYSISIFFASRTCGTQSNVSSRDHLVTPSISTLTDTILCMYLKLYVEASLYEYITVLQSLWADVNLGKDGITNLTTLFHDLQTIKKSAIYKSLVQYIRDRDILDVLFQQCLNTETLRLSLSLFFNIYLTNKDIDIFYEAAHNNRIYESIQATTFICQLLPLFPNQQREYLQSLLLNTCDNICISKLLVLYLNDIPESQPIPDSIRNSIKTVGDLSTDVQNLCLYLQTPKPNDFIEVIYQQILYSFLLVSTSTDSISQSYLTSIVHRCLLILKLFIDDFQFNTSLISIQTIYKKLLLLNSPIYIQIYILQWLYSYYIHVIEVYPDNKLDSDINDNKDKSGIKLLILLFEEINLRNEGYIWDEQRDIYIRNSMTLKHEEKIWKITMLHDKRVELLNYLIDLYLNVSNEMVKKSCDLTEKFLKIISQFIIQKKDDPNSYLCRRCLQLLLLFYKRIYLSTPQKPITVILPTSHETFKSSAVHLTIPAELTAADLLRYIYGDECQDKVQTEGVTILRGLMYGNKTALLYNKKCIPYHGETFFIEDITHPGCANSPGYYIELNSQEFFYISDYIEKGLAYNPLRLPSSLSSSQYYHPVPSDILYTILINFLRPSQNTKSSFSIGSPTDAHNSTIDNSSIYDKEAIYILRNLPPYVPLLDQIKQINENSTNGWNELLDIRYPGYITYVLEIIHYLLYEYKGKDFLTTWFKNAIYLNDGYKSFFNLLYTFEPSSEIHFNLYTLLSRFLLTILYHQLIYNTKKRNNISKYLSVYKEVYKYELNSIPQDIMYTLLTRIAEIIQIALCPSSYIPPQLHTLKKINSHSISFNMSHNSLEEVYSSPFPPPPPTNYFIGAYRDTGNDLMDDNYMEVPEKEEIGLMNTYEEKERGEGEEKPIGELIYELSYILNTVEIEGEEETGKKKEKEMIDMFRYIGKREEDKNHSIGVQYAYSLLRNRLKTANKEEKYDVNMILYVNLSSSTYMRFISLIENHNYQNIIICLTDR
ncbi:hypothetical protein WA158_002329 [Blastocystis sp. Blastoise]